MNQILYDELLRLARAKDLSTYGKVAPLIELSMDVDEDRHEIAILLGEIARHEHENNRPMLTSLIIHSGDDNNPGEGFFSIAMELENYDGSHDQLTRVIFWSNQVTLVHNHWAQA